jgi:hypothetical protein
LGNFVSSRKSRSWVTDFFHKHLRAAGLAIKYKVPQIAVTAVIPERDFATLLDDRLKRIEQMKLIEAKPNANGEKADARLPPSVPDRRYRRI